MSDGIDLRRWMQLVTGRGPRIASRLIWRYGSLINRFWSYKMRWKEIKENASGAPPPAGWAEALDQGIDDVDHGRVTHIGEVISDLDSTLSEMAIEADDRVDHGNTIPNSATANKRT